VRFKGAEMRCIAPFENFRRILIRVRMAGSLPEADLYRPPEMAKMRHLLPFTTGVKLVCVSGVHLPRICAIAGALSDRPALEPIWEKYFPNG